MWIQRVAGTPLPPAIQGNIVDDLDAHVDDTKNAPSLRIVKELNDNLSGFKFYPIGTSIVGLVSDDSAYKDSNGNYILADSATGQSMIDNITYKSISSTEDTRGSEGADTAIPFTKDEGNTGLFYKSDIKSYKSLTGQNFSYDDTTITLNSRLSSTTYNGSIILKSLSTKKYNQLKFSFSSVSSYKANNVTVTVYDEDNSQNISSETLSVNTTTVSKNYTINLEGAENISIRVSVSMSPSGSNHSNTTTITNIYTK